jgi:tetratricopeptide (TPR) repeat protein
MKTRSLLMTLIFSLSLLSSCSWIKKRRSFFWEDSNKNQVEEDPSKVSKAQYEKLMEKYEHLLKRHRESQWFGKKPGEHGRKSEKIVNDLGRIRPKIELAETIDLFGKPVIEEKEKEENLKLVKVREMPTFIGIEGPTKNLQEQIENLIRARGYVERKKLNKAMDILKKLDKSNDNQIRVRAKFYIGEVLYIQEEYDLAMQVFEEIISKHAFSAMTIKSLNRLVDCSKKLELSKKERRYYSILKDIFKS